MPRPAPSPASCCAAIRNFLKSLYLLDKLYRPELLLADHRHRSAMRSRCPAAQSREPTSQLYIHPPRGRKGRAIDAATENFVDATRVGSTP